MIAEHADAASTAESAEDLGLQYRSLGEFLEFFLGRAYRRRVTDNHDLTWCPEPWLHEEAYERLEALWLSREAALISPDLTAIARWWLLVADPTMRVLLDIGGPFAHCSVRNGHRDTLPPLPMQFDKAPPALYTPIGEPSVAPPEAA